MENIQIILKCIDQEWIAGCVMELLAQIHQT